MYLPKTENILSILKPIELKEEITNLSKLVEVIQQNNPKYTVLPKDFFDSVLSDAHNFKKIENGAWVELGVWKGGGALFLKSLMNELDINEKLYLIDTFGKIPTYKLKHPKDIEFINSFRISEQSSYLKDVTSLFDQFDLNENVWFIESDINDIKKQNVPDQIAFLFIDLDFHEPVYEALILFYDNMVKGGVLIIDDYYLDFLNCKEAVDQFFKEKDIDLKSISSRFSSYAIKIVKR
jgi:hypothetical protein